MTLWYENGEKDKKIARDVEKYGSVVRKREKTVETLFRRLVNGVGGLCLKWVSPGNAGVPDRKVFYRGEQFLVELKTDTGDFTESQRKMFPLIMAQGIPVYVLRNRDQVEDWVARMVDGRSLKRYEYAG